MVYASVCALLALALGLLFGIPAVAWLRGRKLGKAEDIGWAERGVAGAERESYAGKAGTPTMGGVIFLLPLAVVALPSSIGRDFDVALPLIAMSIAAVFGAVDDFQTLQGRAKLSGHE